MSMTTDHIDRLHIAPLDFPGGWRVSFRSANAGCCHQLYANRRLIDWTEDAEDRSFRVSGLELPSRLIVVAVSIENRCRDFAENLAATIPDDGWVFQAVMVRSTGHARGDRVEILTDRATGEMDETPLSWAECWPAWAVRWAWGESEFALGGFGFDGIGAPGLGRGAMGAGQFGFDADLIRLRAILREPGRHRVVLRTRNSEGRFSNAVETFVTANPPPAAPVELNIESYDPAEDCLTLSWATP